jgi:hypothetical protein
MYFNDADRTLVLTRGEFAALLAFREGSTPHRARRDLTRDELRGIRVDPAAGTAAATNGEAAILLTASAPAAWVGQYTVPTAALDSAGDYCRRSRRVRLVTVRVDGGYVHLAALSKGFAVEAEWRRPAQTAPFPPVERVFADARDGAARDVPAAPFGAAAAAWARLIAADGAAGPGATWTVTPPAQAIAPVYATTTRTAIDPAEPVCTAVPVRTEVLLMPRYI